ncbi:MAG: short-chain dehydrogenase [Acidimicrobiales bacterium]|nr:short-chain dehydrogenase [Acidimicrobiales bacterium]
MTLDRSAASLDGRVAIVTGAAQGIGAGIATTLAAFGADVAICDRRDQSATVAGVEARGRRAFAAMLDVRDGSAVAAFVADVVDQLGPVHTLVNNAGGGFWSEFMDVRDKGQHALVDENFTSVTNFVRACVPVIVDGGSIVNVTSIEAFRAAPGFGVYAAMKAAVENLSRTLALELAGRRIRVNCLAPDAIPTPGDAGLAAATGVEGSDGEGYGWKVPFGTGTPDDCAGAVVFLASALSRFVTGTTIHVDGGSHAASGWRRRGDEGPYEP